MVVWFKRLYSRWIKIGKRVAAIQTKLLFTLIYFTVIVPFGILVKPFFRPYKSGWIHKETSGSSMEKAKRQF